MTHAHILIGTAGHIDHGKTRLVAALTGIETDRLPEEKARGISIDLGFAHWRHDGFEFGVVDVPGHERFVRNMVAGAAGVNLALLVVAADDGVMPQTREHLEIMDLLGVRTGVAAITKTDLVDAEMVELVEAEIEDLVAGTFLERAPVVPVSSETGDGLDALKAALAKTAAAADLPQTQPLFRLPVDRVFSLEGHGTIVTGSALSGRVQDGDTLELLPLGVLIRVRNVEGHGEHLETGTARRRTALNLAGVKTDDVSRGMELATPGYLLPTRRLVVELRVLPGASLVLKDRSEWTLHLATSETTARIATKGERFTAGDRGYAELRTTEPIVAVWGQRFILRRTSPAVTVAGGTVLDPAIEPKKRIRDLKEYAERLNSDEPVERLSFVLSRLDAVPDSPLEAARRAGVLVDRYDALVEELKSRGDLISVGKMGPLLHRERLESLAASVLRTVRSEVERRHPRRAVPKPTLATACREIARPELLEAVFAHLLESGKLVEVGENLGPADMQVKLTKNQRRVRDVLLEEIGNGGLSPPTLKELAAATGESPQKIRSLLGVCAEDGLLVEVSELLWFTPDAVESARETCLRHLAEHGEATASELREAWGLTRKWALPLCEYFDAVGVTERKGDVRVPR